MKFSIASYSYHRLLRDGQQDMFGYIEECKTLGAAQLDPWNGTLAPVTAEDETLYKAGSLAEHFSAESLAYVDRVKAAADAAGLPFGCLAVDGAHIYEITEAERLARRASAHRWLEVARRLDAAQIRIDAGGKEDMTDEMFEIVVNGYNNDILPAAHALGLEVIIENHWGATRLLDNTLRILGAVEGLGLLLDTNNFVPGTQVRGWELYAPHTRSVHIKTFNFDANGNDPTVDIPHVIGLLVDAGYDGVWGVESVPRDGDERGAVQQTIDLIKRSLNG